jgi:DNA-binding transcriptional LysR family regulator
VAAPNLPRPAVEGPEPGEIPVGAVVLTATPPNRVWRMRSIDGGTLTLKPQPVLRLSSLMMARDATLAGAGVALLPKLLVATDVAAGRLALWGVEDAPPVEIWALQSSRRLVGVKVRAFLDVIDQSFPNKVFIPQN